MEERSVLLLVNCLHQAHKDVRVGWGCGFTEFFPGSVKSVLAFNLVEFRLKTRGKDFANFNNLFQNFNITLFADKMETV